MAIKELAGHASLSTTMRYMHLSPCAKRDAIKGARPTVVCAEAWQQFGNGRRRKGRNAAIYLKKQRSFGVAHGNRTLNR